MIYFIQCGKDGPIKIGQSDSVDKRIRQLQTGSPYPLRVLKTMPGNDEKEYRIHHQLKKYRIHGEWFEPVKAVTDFAFKTPTTSPPKKINYNTPYIFENLNLYDVPITLSVPFCLRLLGISVTKFAEQCGFHRDTLYKSLKNKRTMPGTIKRNLKALGLDPWAS